MTVAEQIRRALAMDAHSARTLHARHVNPTFVQALDLLGFGRQFARASGLTVTDSEGRDYLDFLAGYGAIPLGHNHPEVRAAVEEVLVSEVPQFMLVCPQPLAAELSRRLAAVAPGGLDVCFLGSSGSEAVEGGLKLARLATRRERIVSAERSYHGTTLGALSVTGSKKHRAPFEPLLSGCVRVPWGAVDGIERELRRRDVAAVLLEPLQGEGGVRPPPSGWLGEVAALCRRYGTLLILDEVQTGLGRCGAMFACESEGVEPDVLLLAKGLSGGVAPVSALLTRRKLWERAYGSLSRYDLHCSTFGGGAVACAAALATIEILQRDRIPQSAAALGEQLGPALQEATRGSVIVKEVRGRGLFWGIELDAPLGKVGAELAAQWLVVGLLGRGILTQACGCAPEVVRVQPPLTVTRAALDRFCEALAATLREHATGRWSSVARPLLRVAGSALRG
jgi:putrescine aminotransferase